MSLVNKNIRTRYTTRDTSTHVSHWEADPWPMVPDIRVTDREPAPTGIVDKDGREYLRMPDTIGFLRK